MKLVLMRLLSFPSRRAIQLRCINENLRRGLVVRWVDEGVFGDHHLLLGLILLQACSLVYLGDLLHLERVLDIGEVGRVAHARMVMLGPLCIATTATTLILILLFSRLSVLLRDQCAGGRLVLVLMIRLDCAGRFRGTAVSVAVVRLDLRWGYSCLLLVETTYTNC